MTEDFEIRYKGGDDGSDKEVPVDYAAIKKNAVEVFDPENRIYSTYLSDNGSSNDLSYSTLETLANSPQSDLSKTTQIIALNRKYANKNDIIGMTVECIDNNINTDIRLSYKSPKKGVIRKKDIEQAKQLINEFNERINLPRLIANAINTTFVDGTFIAYRRKKEDGGSCDYTIDYYSLGSALISDYEVGGDPYVLIDIAELKNRLQKTYPRTKKRKGLFFDNMEQEIKATYPPEVYDAYKANETYAKLNIDSTCVLRIGNQNKKYGLSPIFRALYPIMMLDSFDEADRTNARARSKKIIAQTMNKEILGENYDRDTYSDQAYAHKNFLDAWKQKTVVVTVPPTVKMLSYVEPKVEMTSVDTVSYYRARAMATLGISFLLDAGSTSAGVANLSIKQLMKRINKISKQLEFALTKWYKGLLRDNGISPELAPTVSIIDSEMMEMSMKIDLANLLFTKLNCSYETAFNTLGLSLEDEAIKRQMENEEGVENVFTPRLTAYTNSGSASGAGGGLNDGTGNGGGRPAEQDSDSPDKQDYDKNRYETLKETGG